MESRAPVERVSVCKVNPELGIVFGWGIECLLDGKPIYDSQNSHISEDEMLKASADFMAESGIGNDDHDHDADDEPIPAGRILFAFPMTGGIAKSLGIETKKTGLIIGYKPTPEILKRYVDGDYTGFSIGGSAKRHYVEDLR